MPSFDPMKHFRVCVGFGRALVNAESEVIYLSQEETLSSLFLKLSALSKSEILHVSYIDSEKDQVSCDSECEFKELLKVVRDQELKGKYTILQVKAGDPWKISRRKSKKMKMRSMAVDQILSVEKQPKKVEPSQIIKNPEKNERLSAGNLDNKQRQANLGWEEPPAWFTGYMQKFNDNLFKDIAHLVESIIEPLKGDQAKMMCWLQQNTVFQDHSHSNMPHNELYSPKQIESEHNYATCSSSETEKEKVEDKITEQENEFEVTKVKKRGDVLSSTGRTDNKEEEKTTISKDECDPICDNSVSGDDDFSVLSGEISVTDSDSENECLPGDFVTVPMPACFNGLKIRTGNGPEKSLKKRSEKVPLKKQTQSLTNDAQAAANSAVNVIKEKELEELEYTQVIKEGRQDKKSQNFGMDLIQQPDPITTNMPEKTCSVFKYDSLFLPNKKNFGNSYFQHADSKCFGTTQMAEKTKTRNFTFGISKQSPANKLQHNDEPNFRETVPDNQVLSSKGHCEDQGNQESITFVPNQNYAGNTVEAEAFGIGGSATMRNNYAMVPEVANKVLRTTLCDGFGEFSQNQNKMRIKQQNQYTGHRFNCNYSPEPAAVYSDNHHMKPVYADVKRAAHTCYPLHGLYTGHVPVHFNAGEFFDRSQTQNELPFVVHEPSDPCDCYKNSPPHPFVMTCSKHPFHLKATRPPHFPLQHVGSSLPFHSFPKHGQQLMTDCVQQQDPPFGEQMPEAHFPLFKNGSNSSLKQEPHKKVTSESDVHQQNHNQFQHRLSHGDPVTILPEKLMQIASSAVSTACNIVGSLGSPGSDTTLAHSVTTGAATTVSPELSTPLKYAAFMTPNLYQSQRESLQFPESPLFFANIGQPSALPQHFKSNPFSCTDASFTNQTPNSVQIASYNGNLNPVMHENKNS